MVNTRDIQMRDPFVVPVEAEGVYYLYGTTDPDVWRPPGVGFDAYRGSDLERWEGPLPAFRPGKGFWGDRNFWAPEVHRYRGEIYMFASFKAPGHRRGTQVLASETFAGPFRPHSDGPVTPEGWECLDGTLYVDEAGRPWMVFCHEWVQVGDGEMCAMPLSGDLRSAAGEPVLLFRASEAPWVREHVGDDVTGYVTDGPFLHRTAAGGLLMLWASHGEGAYVQGIARSESGEVTGPWGQQAELLFDADGGHGMVFRTFYGRLMLALHSPNDSPNERPRFLPVVEAGETLRRADAGEA
jgi:beta-xylosidase